jgi:hypothetical protein
VAKAKTTEGSKARIVKSASSSAYACAQEMHARQSIRKVRLMMGHSFATIGTAELPFSGKYGGIAMHMTTALLKILQMQGLILVTMAILVATPA